MSDSDSWTTGRESWIPAWSSGQKPWIRAALPGEALNAQGYAQCYFCGAQTAKLSAGDLSGDTGRVEVYCNNSNCDAREVAVIVVRDGHGAGDRADVRVLRALDEDNHTTDPRPMEAFTIEELGRRVDQQSSGMLQRRTDEGPASYAAPGI